MTVCVDMCDGHHHQPPCLQYTVESEEQGIHVRVDLAGRQAQPRAAADREAEAVQPQAPRIELRLRRYQSFRCRPCGLR